MAAALIDVSAVPVPPALARGLRLLVRRTICPDPAAAADLASEAVLTALFGNDAPTFGRLHRVHERDLRDACVRAGVAGAAIAGVRELAELLPRITPDLPACASCGELPLANVGGKISALAAGATCPHCLAGPLAVTPLKMRKVAWTDARLIEPHADYDLRSPLGDRIPLTDALLLEETLGGWMHLGLQRQLADAGVPLYGWLAYMRHQRYLVTSLADAARVAQKPDAFGLAGGALTDAVREAGLWLAGREQTNLPQRPRYAAMRGIPEDAPRVTVAGRTYLIEGRLDSGDVSDVWRGCLDSALSELVVIKTCRRAEDAPVMRREVATLSRLAASNVRGVEHFVRLLPVVVAHGDRTDAAGAGLPVTVFRHKNRFDWTLEDVLREYPDGIDPETMVWMWNRTLMQLSWIQRNRLVHGALAPAHMLIHPGNHGMALLDWAHAVPVGGIVSPPPSALVAYQPDEVRSGAPATPETDIAMSARVMIAVLGGDPATGDVPTGVPEPLADALRIHARYDDAGKGRRIADALALHEEFGRIAEGVYGPRRYHRFPMPRRSR